MERSEEGGGVPIEVAGLAPRTTAGETEGPESCEIVDRWTLVDV
jgi:hypothetical protein